MVTIQKTIETNELTILYSILMKSFKQYELVKLNDFIYYVQNYCKLYPNENYIAYKIEYNGFIIGGCSAVILNEFILVDYLVINKDYRYLSKQIMNTLIDILVSYNRPIIVEAETESLCRLYHMFNFNRFNNPYTYYTIQDNKIYAHKSNLLYMSKYEPNFSIVQATIYRKYYLRWYSIYDPDIIGEYTKIINGKLTT